MQAQITSVIAHNSKQHSLSSMFQNENGSLKKSGFVVTHTVNGLDMHQYARTLAMAEIKANEPSPEIFNRPDSWGTY